MADDEKPAADAAKASPKAAASAAAAKPVRLSFQTFATGLDPATRNAFRVYLGLRHSDVGTEFEEADLQAKLDAMHNNIPHEEA